MTSSSGPPPPLRSLRPAGNIPASPPTRVPRQKRATATAACEACRRRKSRCSAQRPQCGLCIRLATECHYVADSNETRVQAIRRRNQELISERDDLSLYQALFRAVQSMADTEASQVFTRLRLGESVKVLLDQIKTGRQMMRQAPETQPAYEEFYHLLLSLPEDGADRLVRLARSGSDVATVIQSFQEADLLIQLSIKPEIRRIYEFPHRNQWPAFLRTQNNVYLKATLHDSQRQSTASNRAVFDMPFSAATLIEPGLGDVKISKWTTVIAEESILVSLLNHYFLFDYPFFHFFHKDLFLADLKAGRTEHCSSLLVNAVLAAASHYHPSLPGRNEPWNGHSLSYRLFAEAKRLWELELGEYTLTTLQSALIMNAIYNMDGLDQIGHSYMVSAAKIAYNMDLFAPQPVSRRADMELARQFTAWSFFSWQATVCFHYSKPPLFNAPPATRLPDPHEDSQFYGEVYIKYPLSEIPSPLWFSFTFLHTAKFRVILNEISNDRYGDSARSKLSFETATEYYFRLRDWFENLPTALKPHNIALPAHLELHLHFQCAVILILEPFMTSDLIDVPLATKHGNAALTPRELMSTSWVNFETIARLYYTRHSFSTYAPVMLQFLSMLGFRNVGRAEESPIPSWSAEDRRSTLLLVLKGLYSQAAGSYLSTTVLSLLYKELPAETSGIADTHFSPKVKETLPQIMANHIRAAYPVNMVSVNAEVEEHRLNVLLGLLQERG